MLSVRGRADGGKAAELGFRSGRGGSAELEEGEACSGGEDDNLADPDVALFYIDEKLQDVLGHFQKDFFEGVVSAENLGAKFGEYGSFLPAYQRSATWPQPRSPPRGQNQGVSRSPCNSSFETPQAPTAASVSRNNNPPALRAVDNLGKISKTKFSAGEPVPQHNSIDKPANGNDQKTLKVRIKVGPSNSSVRNNTAIYSGLGLDISPSSSAEDSPDWSGGLSPKLQHALNESPTTILQIMTCFSVPGGYLLSPLPDSMLHLSKKGAAFLKNCKTGSSQEGFRESSAPDVMLPGKDVNDFIENKIKPAEKSRKIIEAQSSNSKDGVNTALNTGIVNGTPEGQKLVTEAASVPVLSGSKSADLKTQRQIVGDSVKATGRTLDLRKESNLISQDRVSSPDLEQGYQSGSIESIKNNATSYSRGKPNSNTISEEKPLQHRNRSDHNDTSSGTWREDKAIVDKNYDTGRADPVAYRARKAQTALSAKSPNLMPAQKSTLYEQDSEKTRTAFSEGKRKLKENLSNTSPAVELTKETMMVVSSATLKEKKKSSHSRDDHSGKKSKGLKSRNEGVKDHGKESRGALVGDVNVEATRYRTDLEMGSKDTHKELKLEHEVEPNFPEKSNDTSVVRKFRPISKASVDAPVNAPPVSSTLNSDAAATLQAPVVIKENWVMCDLCQEWRLLPYEADAVSPSTKWQCSMQTWLPGLNKCHISEAETTKALNALYQIPVPESGVGLNGHPKTNAAPMTSISVPNFNQRHGHMQPVPVAGKKKHVLKDEPNFKGSAKNRSLNNVNECSPEANLSNKINLGHTSKSSDYGIEKRNSKQHEKYKLMGQYSDGGNNIENDIRLSKSKSKREDEKEGFRSSKKSKKEGSSYRTEDSHSNVAVAGRDAFITDNSIPSKTAGKSSQKSADYPSSKDLKRESKEHLPASIKRRKDEMPAFTTGEVKEHFSSSNVEKSGSMDISAKKRKLKEWQASQDHEQNRTSNQHTLDGRVVQEAFSESNIKKQKKAKVSSSDGKEPRTVDRRMDEGRGVAGKEELGKGQVTAVIRRGFDSTGNLKRDMSYAQSLAAATSSSSKVSGSRRSKANTNEARGSPVESVSSSPFRTFNTEKLSTKRSSAGKSDVLNIGFLNTGSPKRCSDVETDGASDRSGTRKETAAVENQRAAESGFLGSFREIYDFHDNDANQSGGKAGDLRSKAHIPSSPLFDDRNVVSGTGNTQHTNYSREASGDDHNHDQDKLSDQHRVNRPSQWKSGKSASFGSKEECRGSKHDLDKAKLNVSDFSKEHKESLATKNDNSHQSDSEVGRHGRSTHHEHSRVKRRDAQENDEKDHKYDVVKSSIAGRKDGHPKYGVQENIDTNGSPMLSNKQKDIDSKIAGASCNKYSMKENLQRTPQQDDKSCHVFSERVGRSKIAPGKGKSQLIIHSEDKQEVQTRGSEEVPTHVNGSKSEVSPGDAVNGDALKVVKQSRKLDSQGLPNFTDTSCTVRKNSHPSAATVMKEARDLKHTANRLKSEGLQLESTGLYFEAALKFLHVASLREPPSGENAKHGEAISSMQMYSDTASLCEFCAREFEKCKEMAAASLAYKCMEVAYMKVAYYKHRSASKDRHELQVALQMVPPGDSPSSSASDVDNLNNQGALGKGAPVKGAASPQVAGSHIIAAPNRPNVIRMLDYMNNMTCAFEATRKSQSAMTAAINQGKYGADDMSSVKRALDFNFHNMEGFLRLTRLSMESIGP